MRESDGQGGYIDGLPVLVDTVWAKVLRPRFADVEAAGAPTTAITQGITLRYREDIGYDWELGYHGMRYRIVHIEYSPKRDTVTLTCEAVSKHG